MSSLLHLNAYWSKTDWVVYYDVGIWCFFKCIFKSIQQYYLGCNRIRFLLWITVTNIWKVAAALFKYMMLFLPRRLGLPEGVSKVHAPSFQLLWVVGGHVGKFSEDVKVRGVSWWTTQRKIMMKIMQLVAQQLRPSHVFIKSCFVNKMS